MGPRTDIRAPAIDDYCRSGPRSSWKYLLRAKGKRRTTYVPDQQHTGRKFAGYWAIPKASNHESFGLKSITPILNGKCRPVFASFGRHTADSRCSQSGTPGSFTLHRPPSSYRSNWPPYSVTTRCLRTQATSPIGGPATMHHQVRRHPWRTLFQAANFGAKGYQVRTETPGLLG